MAMTVEVACDEIGCSEVEEISAGVLEGNVVVAIDLGAEGWLSVAGEDYCPKCAPKHQSE
ncbi:hypothetical protein [Mycolicibacterium peregrinum]|uniref:hypothetical protein n=1 Tax=Mycolicibacterium peregrinum TaxID=43304 RepID=UPI003AAB6920